MFRSVPVGATRPLTRGQTDAHGRTRAEDVSDYQRCPRTRPDAARAGSAPGITASERSPRRYLCQEEELEPSGPRIRELAAQTDEVHVLMNNCYEDYAVVNARQLGMLLR